jgi:hypothetical protein
MATRTPLFNRTQPGGVFTVSDVIEHPGDIWWVDSTIGVDGAGYGQNPDSPFATLDYAIGKCTASQGDVIYIAPAHAENITTATAVNFDVAGITVIGLKMGNLMPTFTATAAAGAFTVAAANVTIKNVKLLAGFATGVTQAIAIAAAGDGCTLDGVLFRDSTNNLEYLIHINVATTVEDLTIRNCSFIGLPGGTMSASVLFAGTTVNTLIESSYWDVDSSDSVVDHSAGAATGLLIRRNTIINRDTNTAKYCIELKSDAYGCCHDNRMGYDKVDAEMGLGAGCFWFENYASNTIAESGLLDPATSHAIP